ncbi:MAG: hypothetical protein H0X03_05050 [Nitrosopumilus sp.]|nr:hypothetical protein [Nitrosopumilus sp.]
MIGFSDDRYHDENIQKNITSYIYKIDGNTDKIITIYKISYVFVNDVIIDPNTNIIFILGSSQTNKTYNDDTLYTSIYKFDHHMK